MHRKFFTEEEPVELKRNPYVSNVTHPISFSLRDLRKSSTPHTKMGSTLQLRF